MGRRAGSRNEERYIEWSPELHRLDLQARNEKFLARLRGERDGSLALEADGEDKEWRQTSS